METRKSEIRYTTSDPSKMLNKYLVNRVLRTWKEEFIDEDKNEPVSIERNELIFEKGTLITQDHLAKIRFYMSEGSITEVEVSNQKRQSFELKNMTFYPYIAQVQIKEKKYKFLLYARSIENALIIMKDYIELHFEGQFNIIMIKEFDNCIILLDNLKTKKYNVDQAFLNNEISAEEYLQEIARQVDEEESEENIEKKWYKISSKILMRDSRGDESESAFTFVVNSVSAERANMLINVYLKRKQEEDIMDAERRGSVFDKKEITAAIEESTIIPIGCFIPKEFSEVYND